jgi:hypothetical protein
MQHRITRYAIPCLLAVTILAPLGARASVAGDSWSSHSRERSEKPPFPRPGERRYDRVRRARIEQIRRDRIEQIRRARLEQIRRARIEQIRRARLEQIRRARIEQIRRHRMERIRRDRIEQIRRARLEDRCYDWQRGAGSSRDRLERILASDRYPVRWADDSDSDSDSGGWRKRRIDNRCRDYRTDRRGPVVVHDPRNWPDWPGRSTRRYLVNEPPNVQAAAARALGILTGTSP